MQDPGFRVIGEDSFEGAPPQAQYPQLDANGREITPEWISMGGQAAYEKYREYKDNVRHNSIVLLVYTNL